MKPSQAIVVNTLDAIGRDKQDAPKELIGQQRHHLDLVEVLTVFPARLGMLWREILRAEPQSTPLWTECRAQHARSDGGQIKPPDLDPLSMTTERMVSALGNGVKGGRWFSLIDKVYAPATPAAAWATVRADGGAAGVDATSRWTSTFFAQTGLFTLNSAPSAARGSR